MGAQRQQAAATVFSELDLMRLLLMLDALPEQLHSGVYRRLGDLALFLTGV